MCSQSDLCPLFQLCLCDLIQQISIIGATLTNQHFNSPEHASNMHNGHKLLGQWCLYIIFNICQIATPDYHTVFSTTFTEHKVIFQYYIKQKTSVSCILHNTFKSKVLCIKMWFNLYNYNYLQILSSKIH